MNIEWNGSEITILKSVFYKLMSEGEFGPARVIAQTLFELTADNDVPWGLFWPVQGNRDRAAMTSDGGKSKLQEIEATLANHPEMKYDLIGIALRDAWELGSRLIKDGRPEEALACLNKCISQFEGIHYCAAWALSMMGRLEESAAHLLMAIEIDPANVQNLNMMGQVMNDLGIPAEAEAFLRRAVKIDPNYAMGYYDLGVILAKLRTRDRAARRCFSKAIQLDPNLGWAYYSIACLDALAGRRNKALANLKTALEKGVDDRKHIEQDSDFDSLRGDAIYRRLIAEYFSAKP
jgi:tetratricopeptide (TPR) repeat protein